MRDYKIFLIEDEFADHYYGRETMIYHLFLEHKKTNNEKKKILTKQIDFITKPIPSIRIHQVIEMNMKSIKGYKKINNVHILDCPNSTGRLSIHERFIHLESEGNFEAESLFFEILRKSERFFLAMDFHSDRFGWLTPIKIRKLI